jgi:2-dehydro-3-deoxyphosphogluconate aldolase/(4S)-4-hydroxy-2-oxoglutarate aldolase
MPQDAKAVRAVLSLAPVIPVITLDDVAAARPLAEALVAGGLPVLEVTLRTANAFKII